MRTVFAQYGIPHLVLRNSRYVLSYDPRWGWGVYRGDEPAPIRDHDRNHREPHGDGAFLTIAHRIRIWDDDVYRFVERMAARGHHFVLLEREGPTALLAFDRDVRSVSAAEMDQATEDGRVVKIFSWSSMGDSYVQFARSPAAEGNDESLTLLFPQPVPSEALPETGITAPYDEVDDIWGPVSSQLERGPTDEEAGWPLAISSRLAAELDRHLDSLTTERHSFLGHCQAQRMLPLVSTLVYTWALEPDGTVHWIDHEAFGYPAEPETRRAHIWIALERGARRYPELAEILPLRPLDVAPCNACANQGTDCMSCNGLGWQIRRELR